ncbi:MAG: leucine-rich repeat domain-containing protein, partial [Prevotella sp.]|nr:leucine-rich repeat domain-containing protein [Prevotella sp.]
ARLGLKEGDTFTITLSSEIPDIYFDTAGTLHWKAVDGAVGYRVKISDGVNTAVDECLENNSSNYAMLLALNGFEDGTYEIEIYSVDIDGNEVLVGTIDYEYTVTSAVVGENIFVYDINNGEATITGASINNPDVIIPSEIDGYPVTEIGMMAFVFNWTMETVVIPEGVKKLGWYAFNSCWNLREVTLPESLEYIDSWAFERCTSLETIHIPANVTTVMGGAFAQNDSMTSITCDEKNNNYVSVNGVLFTKDVKAIVAYPGGINGEYTVPATVSRIGDAAFYGAKGLTAVNILGTLDFIGFEGFAECELLTDVTINEGVDYIGYWAFRNCRGIKILTVPQ